MEAAQDKAEVVWTDEGQLAFDAMLISKAIRGGEKVARVSGVSIAAVNMARCKLGLPPPYVIGAYLTASSADGSSPASTRRLDEVMERWFASRGVWDTTHSKLAAMKAVCEAVTGNKRENITLKLVGIPDAGTTKQ